MMNYASLMPGWVAWGNFFGVIFLVLAFLARTFLRAKNIPDLVKKTE
jgi:hypothetical protein